MSNTPSSIRALLNNNAVPKKTMTVDIDIVGKPKDPSPSHGLPTPTSPATWHPHSHPPQLHHIQAPSCLSPLSPAPPPLPIASSSSSSSSSPSLPQPPSPLTSQPSKGMPAPANRSPKLRERQGFGCFTIKSNRNDPKRKPHACHICQQAFSRPHNLKSHLATHSADRPYKCDSCDLAFRRPHDLRRHKKLHTGERPFVCDKCHRSFARLDALNRHQRTERENQDRPAHEVTRPESLTPDGQHETYIPISSSISCPPESPQSDEGDVLQRDQLEQELDDVKQTLGIKLKEIEKHKKKISKLTVQNHLLRSLIMEMNTNTSTSIDSASRSRAISPSPSSSSSSTCSSSSVH